MLKHLWDIYVKHLHIFKKKFQVMYFYNFQWPVTYAIRIAPMNFQKHVFSFKIFCDHITWSHRLTIICKSKWRWLEIFRLFFSRKRSLYATTPTIITCQTWKIGLFLRLHAIVKSIAVSVLCLCTYMYVSAFCGFSVSCLSFYLFVRVCPFS